MEGIGAGEQQCKEQAWETGVEEDLFAASRIAVCSSGSQLCPSELCKETSCKRQLCSFSHSNSITKPTSNTHKHSLGASWHGQAI